MEKMYNIIPYKLKVMHAEENMLNLSPIRQKINAYPSKEKNCGDDSGMVIIDEEHLVDAIISWKIDLKGNMMMNSRYLVVSSLYIGLHAGDIKYRI